MKNDLHTPSMLLGEPITGKQLFIIIPILIGIITTIVFLSPAAGWRKNEPGSSSYIMKSPTTIKVSESGKIVGSKNMKYTGMVSDSIFSIVWGSFGYPLYFPVSSDTLEINGYGIEIVKVTPEFLRFKVLGREL